MGYLSMPFIPMDFTGMTAILLERVFARTMKKKTERLQIERTPPNQSCSGCRQETPVGPSLHWWLSPVMVNLNSRLFVYFSEEARFMLKST